MLRKPPSIWAWDLEGHWPSAFTITVLFERWGEGDIEIRLLSGDSEPFLSDEDARPGAFFSQSFKEETSLELAPGLSVHARVKLNQKVMDYNVDTVTLSVEGQAEESETEPEEPIQNEAQPDDCV